MYNVTKNKKKKIGGNEEEPARLRGRGKVSVSDPEELPGPQTLHLQWDVFMA